MFTIYIIDRANQFSQQTFATQEAADNASDQWEAVGGCEVYTNADRAMNAKLAYERRLRRRPSLNCQLLAA